MGAPLLLSPALYLMATTLLLPGTTLLLGNARDQKNAIDFLVAACSLLVTVALHDLVAATQQRRRAKSIAAAAADGAGDLGGGPSLTVPVCMLVGGVCFLGGSVLYLPSWATVAIGSWTVGRIGTWVFRTGTVAYLAGCGFSLAPMLRARSRSLHDRLDGCTHGTTINTAAAASTADDINLAGVISYIVGALLYLAGGIVSEAGRTTTGAQLWVGGSGFFVLGAFCFVLAASPPRPNDATDEATAPLLQESRNVAHNRPCSLP